MWCQLKMAFAVDVGPFTVDIVKYKVVRLVLVPIYYLFLGTDTKKQKSKEISKLFKCLFSLFQEVFESQRV